MNEVKQKRGRPKKRRASRSSVAKGLRGQNAFQVHLESLESGNVEVWNNPINFEGVDIVVKDRNGKPIRVFEVTNYAGNQHFSKGRAKRYINSLNFWRLLYPTIYRAIVVSYPYTVDHIKGVRQMFKDEGIEVWVFKEVK